MQYFTQVHCSLFTWLWAARSKRVNEEILSRRKTSFKFIVYMVVACIIMHKQVVKGLMKI